jgi:hypothetical protein
MTSGPARKGGFFVFQLSVAVTPSPFLCGAEKGFQEFFPRKALTG